MSEVQVELLVQNQKGLHARAAAAFVKSISGYDAEVLVSKNGQEVDGSSILGLMMLGASQGSTIVVKASGNQAEEAIKAVSVLVNSLFGEEV
jgi:phosphocarrier protein